jgi:DNA-binding transcriptional LysR family regulator
MATDPMKRRVRLRDLDTLLTVVQAGGMRKAALHLHLSQPAVSKAMRSLEDALGVTLLNRSRRGVEPTAFGNALAQRTKAAFDELGQAVRDIEHLGDPEGGELHGAAMETLNAGLVGAAVERMARRYRRMRFLIETGDSYHLIDHFLHNHLVEFAIARPRLPLPAELVGERLFVDRYAVVVGAPHRHAKRRRIALDELGDEQWITSIAEAKEDSPLGRAFASTGVPMPTPRLVSASLNMRYALLATGQWVTLIPRSILHFMPPPLPLKALPIELPSWEVPNMIVTNRDRTVGPVASKFLDTVRELSRSFRA